MQGIDAYDMSDPVDILKDLGKFDEDVAKTEKWALRKAVLTRLKTLAKVCQCNGINMSASIASPFAARDGVRITVAAEGTPLCDRRRNGLLECQRLSVSTFRNPVNPAVRVQTPRLAPGDYGDVLRRLKIVISKDSNLACVIEAVACCGALAKGLRDNFAIQARGLTPVLLDRCNMASSQISCSPLIPACNVIHDYLAAGNVLGWVWQINDHSCCFWHACLKAAILPMGSV